MATASRASICGQVGTTEGPEPAGSFNPSKGVDYYAYLGNDSDPFQVVFTWPLDRSDTFNTPGTMYYPGTIEIE